MQRACDSCGENYEAKRPASRFCTTNCRVRYANGHQSAAAEPDGQPSMCALEESTRAELVAVDRVGSATGQLALVLARRIDSGRDTGAGLASLARQLRDTLAAATVNAVDVVSPLDKLRDELAARRSA